jgi:chromosomal replication initiator protein DnaA
MPESSKIKTSLDFLVNLVNKWGKIKLQDAAKALDMDEASVEELVKILVEHKIIELHYSIVGDKILKRGEKLKGAVSKEEIKRHVEETLSEEELKKAKEAEKVEKLLGIMKKRISERRKRGFLEPKKIEEVHKKEEEEREQIREELKKRKREEEKQREREEEERRRREEELKKREKEIGKIKEEEERRRREEELRRLKKEEEERRRREEEALMRREEELRRLEEELRRKDEELKKIRDETEEKRRREEEELRRKEEQLRLMEEELKKIKEEAEEKRRGELEELKELKEELKKLKEEEERKRKEGEEEKRKKKEAERKREEELMKKQREIRKKIKLNKPLSYFTFDNFVVGENNKLACAGAKNVAKTPGVYNPLFIYSGVGLGKTHLLNAIGNEVLKRNQNLKVVYVTSEEFENELIDAIENDTIDEFNKEYRSVDYLLIDDIEFISGKDRTQEEFFHIFNVLYQKKRQIVLTSDRPPRKIPDLEDRLESRFEGGLIVDILPPTLETRIAILKKKANEKGVEVPDSVLSMIANLVKYNIRELEGSLNKVIALASVSNEPIDLELANKALDRIIQKKEKEKLVEKEKEKKLEELKLERIKLIRKIAKEDEKLNKLRKELQNSEREAKISQEEIQKLENKQILLSKQLEKLNKKAQEIKEIKQLMKNRLSLETTLRDIEQIPTPREDFKDCTKTFFFK